MDADVEADEDFIEKHGIRFSDEFHLPAFEVDGFAFPSGLVLGFAPISFSSERLGIARCDEIRDVVPGGLRFWVGEIRICDFQGRS